MATGETASRPSQSVRWDWILHRGRSPRRPWMAYDNDDRGPSDGLFARSTRSIPGLVARRRCLRRKAAQCSDCDETASPLDERTFRESIPVLPAALAHRNPKEGCSSVGLCAIPPLSAFDIGGGKLELSFSPSWVPSSAPTRSPPLPPGLFASSDGHVLPPSRKLPPQETCSPTPLFT